VRYIGRHGTKRVSKAVLIGAVPPLMLKTEKNPGGLPLSAFDQIRAGVIADRSQFFKDLTIPFYGYNKPDAKISQGVRDAFWLQGMQVSIVGAYDCIKAFFPRQTSPRISRDRRANLDPAWGRRPDRAYSSFGSPVCEAHQKLDIEGLSGRAARMCTTLADKVNADLLDS